MIQEDPFYDKKITFEDVDIPYLTLEELQTIMEKSIQNDRLRRVRDIFVFSCFTFVALTNVCLIINKLQTNNKGMGNGLETTCLHHFA